MIDKWYEARVHPIRQWDARTSGEYPTTYELFELRTGNRCSFRNEYELVDSIMEHVGEGSGVKLYQATDRFRLVDDASLKEIKRRRPELQITMEDIWLTGVSVLLASLQEKIAERVQKRLAAASSTY